MSDPRPVIFGEVLFDCFEDGTRSLGGAPFNVAWHLAAFGLDPLLVSRVGDDDAGEEILAAMHDAGMRTGGVTRDPAHRTGAVRVALSRGQPDFEIVDDSAWDHVEAPPGLSPPALVYHGSLALRHDANRTTLDTVLGAPAAPVFMDVNLRRPWWRPDVVEALIERARWLKINDEELSHLAPAGDSLPDRARALLTRHRLERVIVTRGERGAFSVDADGALVEACPGTPVTVVDTVGAGDAFAAVCIVGLLRRWPWPVTMSRAQGFAAELVGRRGAVVRDPGVYRERLRDWR